MKKKKIQQVNNLVAKHARDFNKAQVFKDRTKYYRKDKHKNLGSFLNLFPQYI